MGIRARGLQGAADRIDSGKAIIFRAKAKNFLAEASSQDEKKFVFIKRNSGIHFDKGDKVPKCGIFY